MDRLARFREVVAKAKAHPVYREKLRDVDPEKLTLKDLFRVSFSGSTSRSFSR